MFPLTHKAQKILIAPLNWGLGHATRCIPIIKYCLSQGKEVIIASDGDALELLSIEFPNLEKIELPAYNVKYNGTSLLSIIIGNSLNIFIGIFKEHFQIKSIVKKYNPDYIISDSRFGLWIKNLHCTFVTHQLNLHSHNRFLRLVLNIINGFFLKRFDEIWILDNDKHQLSGKLSQNEKIRNVKYIGPVTRLKNGTNSSLFKLIHSLMHYIDNVILVRGTNTPSKLIYPKSWVVKNRIDAKEINKIILSSDKLISRSGYTSIMDYFLLKKSAVLIPTPGQSEQEYLASYLNGKFGFKILKEENINQLIDIL